MHLTNAARLMLGVLPALIFFTNSSEAQTSIGFEDPGDNDNILDYRLPDWAYRTWVLSGELDGGGHDSTVDETAHSGNSLKSNLKTQFTSWRSSEQRLFRFEADAGGSYSRRHSGEGYSEEKNRSLNGSYSVNTVYRHYFGKGPVSLGAQGILRKRYSEYDRYSRTGEEVIEDSELARENYHSVHLSTGVGRIRDVTPLIRAQRLNERLAQLGRDRLTDVQVRELARVLATEHGYRIVFDRPEKSFWRDVLEPMLGEGGGLSTYEIYYLKDIMEEDIGPRSQGLALTAGLNYRENISENPEREKYSSRSRSLSAYFGWFHNPSLNQQIGTSLRGVYRFSNWRTQQGDDRYVTGSLRHLWTIADRYRWDNRLSAVWDYHKSTNQQEENKSRSFRASFLSQFKIFLEDSMALVAKVNVGNMDLDPGYEHPSRKGWNWSYGLGVEYYLDRFLY
ncbi:MAG: hypothetical protein ABFS42_12010 [Candidatus Krumholzibacteriota bacterium]